ncbi:Adenine-specific DNA methylase containing a Zn-ribbon [Synechococcus sp. WH 8101]|uniref:DUF1156 domain-containing protein n=1 Tax=Synechococcus sp. WH 8101 TaxID=59932 RepID=UPI001023A384|nr:DUF1156 domain-containing protein [Synechococcus sp. WH 8101]QBE68631.1 Adenine-specific DNA methylase containing a Zn-ribbon [Synechococcus sp. WH 8101]QNI44853.1 D12 class N6 adenine-specific DNA methyltransferase family protein [Synechococcus sp. WH 8101]
MSDHPVKRRKKLIEVAIPLEAINAASAREKSIRHGHPSTLHLWWSRKPTACARAIIFCQLVDDPSSVPEDFETAEDQERERQRLFSLVSRLSAWENRSCDKVLQEAVEEIQRSWIRCCADNTHHPEASTLFNPLHVPSFHDPFAGGCTLPLEAQRLGLDAYASDLNPVASLINIGTIDIPSRFSNTSPVNPEHQCSNSLLQQEWDGAKGIACDLRYYGEWVRQEADRRLGKIYPKISIAPTLASERDDLQKYEGKDLEVIAWIWARTVRSPNPSVADIEVPLTSTYVLSAKPGKEVYLEPLVTGATYEFKIRKGRPDNWATIKKGTQLARGANFSCILTGTPITGDYIKKEGLAGRMGSRLMAVVAEGDRERVFLEATPDQEKAADIEPPNWRPEQEIFYDNKRNNCVLYGLLSFGDLFTNRQLFALNILSDICAQASQLAECHASTVIGTTDSRPLRAGGKGAKAYAEAILLYLSFAISKLADRHTSLATWDSSPTKLQLRNTFARQALAMCWEYGEGNPLCSSSGAWSPSVEWIAKSIDEMPGRGVGYCIHEDARNQATSRGKIVSTDPPYYDNIGYAQLSEFFYVWLRRNLKNVYPSIFSRISIDKSEELVATACLHGGKDKAESYFLDGMSLAIRQISTLAHPAFPVTVYYAFKQSERVEDSGITSTGWETFLEAVIQSGLRILGTWPIRTELSNRVIGKGVNVLASSIALICDRKDPDARTLSSTEFRREIKSVVPRVARLLEASNIAPVDIAQAAIGPGMGIFSGAKAVLNPDDSRLTVRQALIEINAALDEHLSKDEGVLDADSRFAVTFFESFGYTERDFGDAENLAKARNVSVDGVAKAGILRSVAGKACLLRREQLEEDWDPSRDDRLCVWEATQHLIKRLESGGESASAELLGQLKQISGHGDLAANCRALAYRLYNHCEKTKQAEEARAYNGLVIAWPELERLAASQSTETTVQASLI